MLFKWCWLSSAVLDIALFDCFGFFSPTDIKQKQKIKCYLSSSTQDISAHFNLQTVFTNIRSVINIQKNYRAVIASIISNKELILLGEKEKCGEF